MGSYVIILIKKIIFLLQVSDRASPTRDCPRGSKKKPPRKRTKQEKRVRERETPSSSVLNPTGSIVPDIHAPSSANPNPNQFPSISGHELPSDYSILIPFISFLNLYLLKTNFFF